MSVPTWSVGRPQPRITALVACLCIWAAPSRTARSDETPVADADPAHAVITGIVVDESGAPVTGAVVSIPASATPNGPTPVTSGEGGHFRLILKTPTPQYSTLIARTANGDRQALLEVQESEAALLDVRLTLKPSRRLVVEVVDSEGDAVADAQVGVIAHYYPIARATTRRDGTAELRIPADAEVDWVFALQPAVGFNYFENYHAWPTWGRPIPPETIRLTLGGTRTVEVKVVDGRQRPISGRVMDVDGRPLAGEQMSCGIDLNRIGIPGFISLKTRADPRGLFVVKGLVVGATVTAGTANRSQFESASGRRVTIEQAGEVDVGVIRVNVLSEEM